MHVSGKSGDSERAVSQKPVSLWGGRQREGSCLGLGIRGVCLSPLICLTLGSPQPAENKQSLSTTPTLPAGRPRAVPARADPGAPLTAHQAPPWAVTRLAQVSADTRSAFSSSLSLVPSSSPSSSPPPSSQEPPVSTVDPAPSHLARISGQSRAQGSRGLGAERNRNPANTTPSARAGREEGVETVTGPHGFCAGALRAEAERGPGIASLGRRSPSSAEMPGGWLSCSGATKQERREANTTHGGSRE